VIRSPAVAGTFYPANADELARTVDALLAAAPAGTGGAEGVAGAYVVPHAGHRFSGATAAHVYVQLRAGADGIARVVMAGPSHRVPLAGCAVPTATQWATPLGRVPIDVDGCAVLAATGHARADDGPHAPEHSLEVQLPFLQRTLPAAVTVLPIAVGISTVEDVAGAIAAAVALDPPRTVVLCSTDLSHYLDEASAQSQDARTEQAILALDPDQVGVRDACGVFALRGLLGWARAGGLEASRLHRCTSADVTGDRSRVVGYGAFAFRSRSAPQRRDQR
jgi:AmmeMemoRadiSam system protein B